MTTVLPRLIRAADVAKVLDLHLKTVQQHTRRGDYAEFAINVGTSQQPRWRYDTARLAKWLDARRAAA
jgi:phage terminase Nu1 subunit (DNA packaging protein)